MFSVPMLIWLAIGAVIFVLDKNQSKYNLKFASYAAFMVSAMVAIGVMRNPKFGDVDYDYRTYYWLGQVVVFFVGAWIWSFMLRDTKPKSKLGNKSEEFYGKIIGRVVPAAEGGINSVSGGSVVVDGNVMEAKLKDTTDTASIKAGTKMLVEGVVGDTLIVSVSKE